MVMTATERIPVTIPVTDILCRDTGTVFCLCCSHSLTRNHAHAIEIARRAVELDPKAAAIWDTLAWLYSADGNQEKACISMEQAIAADPNEPMYKQGLEKVKGGKS